MQSKIFGVYRDILKENSEPVLIDLVNGEENILSAANIYTSVLSRIKDLKRKGFGTHDILLSEPTNFSAFIDFMACTYLGASYFPVNKLTKEKVLNQEFFECEIRKMDHDTFLKGDLSWQKSEKHYPLLIATSGTKKQKVVSYHEEGLLYQLEEHAKIFEKYPHEHKLSMLPKFHCFGFVLDLLLGIYMKKYITFIDPNKNFKNIIQVIKEYEIDFISLVPKQVDLLMDIIDKSSNNKNILSDINLFYGGAPLSKYQLDNTSKVFKNIIEGYGLSEAGPGVMIEGKPLRGINLKIENNLLQIYSPSVADFADKEFLAPFISTKDYFQIKDGRYYFQGRSGELIKNSKGVFEHLSEVQTKIYKKFLREVVFVNRKTGHTLVDYYQEFPITPEIRAWIVSEYPSIKKIASLKKENGIEILKQTNGKAKEDIFNKYINHEGDEKWVG